MVSGVLPPFQSAPADCRREKQVRVQGRSHELRFNPLPPTVGGRSRRPGDHCPGDHGFNPLPPTVGGRRFAVAIATIATLVSIRSRRLSAGEVGFQPQCRTFQGVSIRPRRLSAGEGKDRGLQPSPDCFNPLPPTVGGRRRRRDLHLR